MSVRGRKECRTGAGCDVRTLGEAIYCVVHHSDVEPQALAEQLGVRYGYLMDAANPDRDEVQFQARLLVPAMRITGNYKPLDFIARELGGVFVSLPSAVAGADQVREKFMELVRRAGDASGVLNRVLADGIVTRDEFSEGGELLDSIAAMAVETRSALAQKVDNLTAEGLERRFAGARR